MCWEYNQTLPLLQLGDRFAVPGPKIVDFPPAPESFLPNCTLMTIFYHVEIEGGDFLDVGNCSGSGEYARVGV